MVQGQLFGTGTRYGLKVLRHCGKRVKTKSQKMLTPTFVEVTWEKLVEKAGGLFTPLPPFKIRLTYKSTLRNTYAFAQHENSKM